MEIFIGGKDDVSHTLDLYRFDSHGLNLRLKF